MYMYMYIELHALLSIIELLGNNTCTHVLVVHPFMYSAYSFIEQILDILNRTPWKPYLMVSIDPYASI